MAETLVLVHYHLYPGGVASHLLSSVAILVKKGVAAPGVTFLLGSADRSEWFFDALKRETEARVAVALKIVPELFYWEGSIERVPPAAERLKDALSAAAGDDKVLWVHNPTLGKNPALILALKALAAERPAQKIWMHVHDSAEQGRWGNLGLMTAALPKPYYFDAPGTRWIAINRSDEEGLLKAGLPRQRLFYVPNPLRPPAEAGGKGRPAVARELSAFAATHGYRFAPERPWLLFAGRTIRRKNLLEAVLVARCAAQEVNLLITLPSDSEDDRPVEALVYGLLRSVGRGVAGFGPALVNRAFSLNDLARASELVVSCSVMEGFGLLYLEFPMLGRPLLARRHVILKDFEGVAADLPHHYFGELDVPLEKEAREREKSAYFRKIKALAQRFGIPEKVKAPVEAFFEEVFGREESVPFSYLSIETQARVVEQVAREGWEARIRALNPSVFGALAAGIADQGRDPGTCAAAVAARFGEAVYVRNVGALSASYASGGGREKFDGRRFSRELLNFYFRPENLRLLLDYRPVE